MLSAWSFLKLCGRLKFYAWNRECRATAIFGLGSFFLGRPCVLGIRAPIKNLLPYYSAHSKLVERGSAFSSLAAFLKKSSPHSISSRSSSFQLQLDKLQFVGLPYRVLCDVAEELVKKLKRLVRREKAARPEARPVFLPYVQKVSHNLKKVANTFCIPVVFSPQTTFQAVPNNKQCRSAGWCGCGVRQASFHQV